MNEKDKNQMESEKEYKLYTECDTCSEAYREKFHCPMERTESLLIRLACQIAHAEQRERGELS